MYLQEIPYQLVSLVSFISRTVYISRLCVSNSMIQRGQTDQGHEFMSVHYFNIISIVLDLMN